MLQYASVHNSLHLFVAIALCSKIVCCLQYTATSQLLNTASNEAYFILKIMSQPKDDSYIQISPYMEY